MMLASVVPGRYFSSNGLADTGLVRGRRSGLGGVRGRGLGAAAFANEAEARAQLAKEAAAYSGGAFVATPAWTAVYGPGGYQLQEEGVIRAYGETFKGSGIADTTYNPVTEEWSRPKSEALYSTGSQSAPPKQYAIPACNPMDIACVAYTSALQDANLVLAENARREFNLGICINNAALNNQGADCGQYAPLPVPAIPERGGVVATPVAAVATPGGGYQAPIAGETAAQQQASATAWAAQQKAMTAQQAASAATNQPNQSVPPAPQPGEVSTSGATTAELLSMFLAGQKTAAATQAPATSGAGFSLVDAEGKILGMDPTVLMLIAAGVGALVLLKK